MIFYVNPILAQTHRDVTKFPLYIPINRVAPRCVATGSRVATKVLGFVQSCIYMYKKMLNYAGYILYDKLTKDKPGNWVASVKLCSWGNCRSQRWHGRPDRVIPLFPTYSTPPAVVVQEAEAEE